MYEVRLLEDSMNEAGNRLSTFELTYPRFVHAQLMTHRLFSRNASSSRAIPTHKLLTQIEEDPVLPLFWGRNQSGMQADHEISAEIQEEAMEIWLGLRDEAVQAARDLNALEVHKQIVNRVVEPWMYITVLVSATEFDNFYYLRGQDAQPEIAWVAQSMHQLVTENEPEFLGPGDWHLPLISLHPDSEMYVSERELRSIAPDDPWSLVKVSVARCARVSYLTHDGQRDLIKDIELHDRLAKNGHWSPFEHAAMAMPTSFRYGNFFGFKQYRKYFSNEHYGKEMD